MNLDDTHLMEYVDGNLSEFDRITVEAAVNESPGLASRVAAMRASALPYAAAFNGHPVPDVPLGVVMCVKGLTGINAKASTPRRAAGLWLSAAFIAGAFFCGTMLKLMSNDFGINPSSPKQSSWVQAVASYQDLYSRETLVNVTEDAKLTARVVDRMYQYDGLTVRIPDLRDVGLAFKRVQRLQFNGKPVAQVVYLPEQGEPIALCITADAGPAVAMRTQQLDDMTAVVWGQNRLSYVLLGKGRTDLGWLGQRISRGKYGVLYGSVGPDSAHGTGAAPEAG